MFLIRLYNRIITGLAVLGAAGLVFISLAIIVAVVWRNTGFRPFQAPSSLVEYVMLFATIAAAPVLLRHHLPAAISSCV